MRTLLANATVITMNPARDVLDTDILIENGVIADMGPGLAGRPENADAERIDLSGRIVIPGLIQSHMHVTQSLFRGLADEMELMDWLQRRIWPLEGAHSPETNAAAARLAAAEGLRSGVTAFIDMGTAHCQDAIFETMRDVGMRGLFGKCMLDLGGTDVPAALMEDTETCLRESERLMNRWHMSAGGRLRYAFAPRFVPSCTETLLTRTRDMARANGVRLHTHASENKGECAYVESLVHMRNLRYLHSIGYTGEDVILAHCIWIDDDELRILADTGTHAVHCPSSNMKLASGIARIDEMLAAGCRVALGLDGAHNHMDALVELRQAGILQKVRTNRPTALSPLQALEMATLGGARALGQEDELGSLEPGKKADLAVINPDRLNMAPRIGRDPVAQVVYQATHENVEATMVDGVFLYRDGKYTTLDLGECLRDAESACARILRSPGTSRRCSRTSGEARFAVRSDGCPIPRAEAPPLHSARGAPWPGMKVLTLGYRRLLFRKIRQETAQGNPAESPASRGVFAFSGEGRGQGRLFFHQKTEMDGKSKNILGKKERKPCAE